MSEDVAVEDEVTNVRSAEVHKRLYCGYGFTGLPDESTRAKVIPIQARRLVGRDIHYHETNVPLLFDGSWVFCVADRRNRRRDEPCKALNFFGVIRQIRNDAC